MGIMIVADFNMTVGQLEDSAIPTPLNMLITLPGNDITCHGPEGGSQIDFLLADPWTALAITDVVVVNPVPWGAAQRLKLQYLYGPTQRYRHLHQPTYCRVKNGKISEITILWTPICKNSLTNTKHSRITYLTNRWASNATTRLWITRSTFGSLIRHTLWLTDTWI